MTTQADIDVINEAFLGLKAEPIESFDDDVEGVQDIERKYLTVKGSLLQHPAFNQSIERVALNRVTAPPDSGYAYDFVSPIGGDLLAIFDSATTQAPYTRFVIKRGKINMDLAQAWAEVLVGSEPSTWAPYIRQMVVACLEAEFAFDITGDVALARYKRMIAYGPPGEDPEGGLVKMARMRAGQQQGAGQLQLGPSELHGARYR